MRGKELWGEPPGLGVAFQIHSILTTKSQNLPGRGGRSEEFRRTGSRRGGDGATNTTLPFPKQPVTSRVDGCQGEWGPPAPEGLWNSIPRQVSVLALWMLPFKAGTAKAAELLMTNQSVRSQWETNAWQIPGLFHNPPPSFLPESRAGGN